MAENRSNFEPELELGSPVVQEVTLDRSRMGTNIAQFQRAVADATEDGKHSTGKQRQGLRFWPKQVKKEQDEANRSTPTALPVSKNMTHGDNGFVDSSIDEKRSRFGRIGNDNQVGGGSFSNFVRKLLLAEFHHFGNQMRSCRCFEFFGEYQMENGI